MEMKKKKYEEPSIERVIIELEQVIAGSIAIGPNDPVNGFNELWDEQTIATGDIEIFL